MLIQVVTGGKTVYISADKVIRLDPITTPVVGTSIVSTGVASTPVANTPADIAAAVELALTSTTVVIP